MSENKNNTQSNPSQRPTHGSGDRNGAAYVTPGGTTSKKGVDERYGPNYSESQGGKTKAPPKSGNSR